MGGTGVGSGVSIGLCGGDSNKQTTLEERRLYVGAPHGPCQELERPLLPPRTLSMAVFNYPEEQKAMKRLNPAVQFLDGRSLV